ncbi:cation:proton antiporter [Mycoplasma sp. P36-A1]|uniref:cation:proton antiporter domain-containing protein n=1 Tax=Mycoplasma sp. P36-A1 TaxID=3252900 RepID=UPI003C2CECDD
MLLSFAYILLIGMFSSYLMKKIKLPTLIGMIITGIIIGPFGLNIIDKSILSMAADLKEVALIIILIRAGLALDISKLMKVGRSALLLCFIPACFEIVGITYFSMKLFDMPLIEGAILGAIIAAVSPAIIIPKMLSLLEKGYGSNKNIPQLVLASASVDDVFVIILFTIFTNIAKTNTFSINSIINIPLSLISAISIGIVLGFILIKLFKNIHIRDTSKVVIILGISFILVGLEEIINQYIPFAPLLSIMTIAIIIFNKYEPLAVRLSLKFNKLWVVAEIILFVLVGTTVNLSFITQVGTKAFVLILLALALRIIGVLVCLIKTNLNTNERIFTALACTPKATVQAALGSIPLSLGLSSGSIIQAIAVLSILICAPLGAIAIDLTYNRLLKKE